MRLPLLATSSMCLALVGATASAAPARHWSGKTQAVAGVDAAAAARTFINNHPELLGCPAAQLEVSQVVALGAADQRGYGQRGATVRLRQVVGGVRSEADVATVRLGVDGNVLGLTQACRQLQTPEPPRVSAAQATAAARGVAPVGDTPGATLVLWGWGAPTRLAWRVTGAAAPDAAPVAVFVDARSGVVREVRELSAEAGPLALAYLSNPYLDDVVEVELGAETAEALRGPEATLIQCRDLKATTPYDDVDGQRWQSHVCSYVYADEPVDGHYLYPPVPYPEVPARDEDSFVAPHLYYTVQRGMRWFEGVGLFSFAGEPINVFANVRWPDALDADALVDPDAPLAALNNAYYTAPYTTGNGDEIGAGLIFGQGSFSDFGYDSDVVLHELTHGAVQTLGGPRGLTFDSQGISLEPAALNEAFADYFSSAISGDPHVGEYAGLLWEDDGSGVRTLTDLRTCPADITGQQHNDSQVFSGGLWATRASLSQPDQALMDQAVYDTLSALLADASIAEATTAVIDEIALSVGASAAQTAREAFEARGAIGCGRALPVTPGGVDTVLLGFTPLSGVGTLSTEDPVPANVQLRLELPEGDWQIRLSFLQARYKGVPLNAYGYNRAPQPLSVFAQADEAIEWTLEENDSGLDVLSSADQVAEAYAVQGEIKEGSSYIYEPFEAIWQVKNSPGSYYLQLANQGEGAAWVYNMSIELTEVEGGCSGCGGGRGSSAASLLLALGVFGRRRRARRSRSQAP